MNVWVIVSVPIWTLSVCLFLFGFGCFAHIIFNGHKPHIDGAHIAAGLFLGSILLCISAALAATAAKMVA